MPEVACEECGAQFGTQYALDRHKDLFHTDWEDKNETDASRRRAVVFRCAFCGAEFGRNQDLRGHIDETHPVEREERARLLDERAEALALQKGRRPRTRRSNRRPPAVVQGGPKVVGQSGPQAVGQGEPQAVAQSGDTSEAA